MSDFVRDKIILVLGMVYCSEDIGLSLYFGQEKRDFIRITSLVNQGYKVFSMDNKHNAIHGRHCNANFNDSRRMTKSFRDQNAYRIDLRASYIILDYFFSPVINKIR